MVRCTVDAAIKLGDSTQLVAVHTLNEFDPKWSGERQMDVLRCCRVYSPKRLIAEGLAAVHAHMLSTPSGMLELGCEQLQSIGSPGPCSGVLLLCRV